MQAWLAGMGPTMGSFQSYTYPDDVGFPIENPNGDMIIMIEMHYDNSQYKKGTYFLKSPFEY